MTSKHANGENENETENTGNGKQRIVVIGASAGGFEAMKQVISQLPTDFNASIFIVWHMASDVRGILPDALNRINHIYASNAYDGEKILPNRIYVAPPDRHLLISDGEIMVTNGPKENRFRPAVDPLFRSAAYHYGSRVIGVILSGALDDGTAGLWTVKQHGGIAVVQDPRDAEVSSMPQNALENVAVDHVVVISDMAALLTRIVKEPLPSKKPMMKNDRTKREIKVARGASSYEIGLFQMGELSPFTCPECHGVIAKYKDGNTMRYRCHTGHAYSIDTLLAALTEKIEDNLYTAIRGIDESMMLLNHIGDHLAELNHPKLAALYFQKAKSAETRAKAVRQTVLEHEILTKEAISREKSALENE